VIKFNENAVYVVPTLLFHGCTASGKPCTCSFFLNAYYMCIKHIDQKETGAWRT